MIPSARRRHALRAMAVAMVAFGGWIVWSECRARIGQGGGGRFPTDDALVGAALCLFAFTLASRGLAWTLRARRAGERASWPLFVDALTTFAALPPLALLAWTALGR